MTKHITLNSTVKVSTGRCAGQIGQVKKVSEDGELIYVDFGRDILVEGEIYPDSYWTMTKTVELVRFSK
jgi:ribosomal protein L24